MSRIVEFSEAGGPEVLRFKDVDVPEAGPGQVRIRVKAIGLNRAESMWREDKYIEPVKFPARLGYEAVGTVDSVGKDVTTIALGDEVNTIPIFAEDSPVESPMFTTKRKTAKLCTRSRRGATTLSISAAHVSVTISS